MSSNILIKRSGLDIRQTNFKDINHKPSSSDIKVNEKNVKMLH